ncbi:MAG TPA: hypothetical protein VIP09_02145 [Dehalococcoidia bacterium]
MSTQWIPVYATLATGTNFLGIGGGTTAQVNGTESLEQAPIAAAGSFNSIKINLSAAPGLGNSYRFQLSINGVASLVLDLTISGLSASGSLTAPVTVARGDLITIKTISAGSPGTPVADLWLSFIPTTTDNFIYFGGAAVNQISAAPQFLAPFYGLNGANISGTETENYRNTVPFAGTLTDFEVSMATAPGVGHSWDLILTQNGSEVAGTALNISGTNKAGSATGLSVAFSAGDYFSFKVKADNTATATRAMNCGICLVPTSAGLFAWGGADNGGGIVTGAETYGLVGQDTQNNIQWNATESAVQRRCPGDIQITRLDVRTESSPGNAKSYTFAPRKNGADSGITAQISGVAGVAANGTGTDNFTAGDLINMRETPAGTPTAMGVLNFALAVNLNTGATATYMPFGVVTREHDVAKDGATTAYYFEAIIATTSGGTGHARLYNVTDSVAVTGSDVTSSSTTPDRQRSSAITLSSDKVYRAEFGGLANGNTYYCYAADLIADVSA